MSGLSLFYGSRSSSRGETGNGVERHITRGESGGTSGASPWSNPRRGAGAEQRLRAAERVQPAAGHLADLPGQGGGAARRHDADSHLGWGDPLALRGEAAPAREAADPAAAAVAAGDLRPRRLSV